MVLHIELIKNKINVRNHEIENAYWFLSIMGGKIILLPEIGSLLGIYTNKKERHPLTMQWGRSMNKQYNNYSIVSIKSECKSNIKHNVNK